MNGERQKKWDKKVSCAFDVPAYRKKLIKKTAELEGETMAEYIREAVYERVEFELGRECWDEAVKAEAEKEKEKEKENEKASAVKTCSPLTSERSEVIYEWEREILEKYVGEFTYPEIRNLGIIITDTDPDAGRLPKTDTVDALSLEKYFAEEDFSCAAVLAEEYTGEYAYLIKGRFCGYGKDYGIVTLSDPQVLETRHLPEPQEKVE